MQKTNTTWIKLWAFGLGVLIITATYLAVAVNPFEITLTYLGLLAAVVIVGLMTNFWGGLMASAVSVFSIVLINQYAGVYPHESSLASVASELAVYLIIGPLAGTLAQTIERLQRQADHWLARAEGLATHDDNFGTLKPEWAKTRLEEEIQRATRYSRPLSIALLQIASLSQNSGGNPSAAKTERVAALQAVIRVARAATQSVAVVAYIGGDQVLLILPETAASETQRIAAELVSALEREMYFPDKSSKSLGKPFREWGRLEVGIASLDGQVESTDRLLERARLSITHV